MLKMWEQALTEAEKDTMAKGMAEFFRKHRVQTPATLFLEMHKPLSTVVGTCVTIVLFVAERGLAAPRKSEKPCDGDD